MVDRPYFISYSRAENGAKGFVDRLCEALEGGSPPFRVWLDVRELKAGLDWDEEIDEALRSCCALLFVMTPDSVHKLSVSKREWTRALAYKKLVIPIRLDPDAMMPFRLEPRHYLDATGSFDEAIAELRHQLRWWGTPEGELKSLEMRLADAERDLPRAESDVARARIRDEISVLTGQIEAQQRIVEDPEGEARRAAASIQRGIERDRQPARPLAAPVRTKFINPPPLVAPTYFQDRHVETGLIGEFLRDEAQRLMVVVGRGGTGKTAMVCRLLRSLEGGQLPDDLGPLTVDGIVYLSARGARGLSVPHLYADLSKLLPEEVVERLDALYRDAQASTEVKMAALLANFPQGPTILLLDNFEDMVDPQSLSITDAELDEALRAVLDLPHHGVKVLITTRLAPRSLLFVHPERQKRLDLDEGLDSPFAENVLRAMDADGRLGLQAASGELLGRARERTRGYPRALEALFAILSADRDINLPELLEDTERRRLLPENVVQALVGEAFSRLDQQGQQVMEALAVFARPVSPSAVDYLLQPYAVGVDSAPVLKRLANMKLGRGEAGRYWLHPVDREYGLSRIPEGEESDREEIEPPFTRFALLDRAADYFEAIRTPREEWKGIDDLAPQLAEFDLRCEGGDFETAANVLLEVDFDYLQGWGFLRLSAELHERLRGKLEDPWLRAATAKSLANAYSSLGRYREAIELYEQALAIDRDIGDRQGEAGDLGGLGNCYADLGETRRAIELHEQALAIAREIGDRQGEANNLGNLGNGYAELGETRRAIELHEQALAIDREIGYRQGEAADLGNMGTCYADLGETRRAIELHEQALAIAREIGYRQGEAEFLDSLGTCYGELGETGRAIELLEQALAIAREIGYRGGESTFLDSLAEARNDRGEHEEAARLAVESRVIAEEIGREASHSASTLAMALLLSGDLAGARAAAEAARRYDVPENNDNVLALLGVIALRQDDRVAAEEAFRGALAETEGLLARNPNNFDALDNRGLALSGLAAMGRGDAEAAVEAFRAARAISRDAGVVARGLRVLGQLALAGSPETLSVIRPAAQGS